MRALRDARVWLSLALVGALSGCSFLLDFDELQKGRPATGGSSSNGGATTSSGGTTSGGGEGGAGCECTNTDADPCTVARCVDSGSGPVCVQQPFEGLVLEREFDPIVSERHYQLTLVAGPSEFYLSSLSATGGASDAIIYRFDSTSASIAPALALSSLKLAGQPVSAPALAVDSSAGLKIHAYVGLRDNVAVGVGVGARAWHVALDANLKVQGRAAVSTTYALTDSLASQSQHPSALNLGTETWGAWINADGTIGVTSAGANPQTLQFGSVTAPASSVALVATRNNRPAALYTVDGGGVFLQTETGVTPLSECQSAAGYYYGTYAAPTSYAGLWLLGWTKSGASVLTSESTLGLCPVNAACTVDPGCDANEAQNFSRNHGVAAQHMQGDPVGVMYYLDAMPTLAPTSSTSFQASVTAVLLRVDFGASPNLAAAQPPVVVGESLLLSTQTTTMAANYRGPDHAASAIIGDVAAVAWIEPTADGNDRVRVQRYKMCLPPP